MNYLWAFVIGGSICAAGQILIDLTGLTPARILTGYVVAGVVLSALGWYAPLAELAGCGATVPLLGFGHLLAKGVRTALEEEGAVGKIKEVTDDGGVVSAYYQLKGVEADINRFVLFKVSKKGVITLVYIEGDLDSDDLITLLFTKKDL